MKAKFLQYWAVPKNRIMLLIFTGLLLCFCSIILSRMRIDSHTVGEVQLETVLVSNAKEVVQVVGVNQRSAMKDPFAISIAALPDDSQKIDQQDSEVSQVQIAKPSGKKTVQKPAVVLPKLTGIISVNRQEIALMEYGEQSKQCSVDEKIGPYQVVQVHENVTLVGPEGTIILEVGR